MNTLIVSLLIVNVILSFFNHIKQNTIMANQTQAAEQLAELGTQLEKANTEIQAKIAELVAVAANGEVSPALQAAIDALVPAAQQLDDIVPDAPVGG